MQFITSLLALIGIMFAYSIFVHSPQHTGRSEEIKRSPIATAIHCFLFQGWNFDLLYDKFFVQPFVRLARFNKGDFIDSIYKGIALSIRTFNRALSFTQSGKVRWYAAAIALGAVIFRGIAEFL